jgi:hypothetical protein
MTLHNASATTTHLVLKMSRIMGGEKERVILWCEKECEDLKNNFNSLARL